MAYDDDFNFDLEADVEANTAGGYTTRRSSDKWGLAKRLGIRRAKKFDPLRWQSRMGGNTPTGWGSAAHPYTEFSTGASPDDVASKLDKKGDFRDKWYKPMFEAFHRAPIAGIMGADYTGPGKNLVTPQQSQFVEAGDVLDAAQLDAQDLLGGYSSPTASKLGYEGPVIMKEGQHDLISAGQDLDIANTEYEREKERIDLAEETAEDIKDEAFKDARIARQEALSGRVPEYERARAGIASTGMAYSAPAERNLEAVQEEGVSDLAGISRQKSEAVDTFKKTLSDLEGERSIADEDMELARRTFATDFASMMQDSQAAGLDLISQARTLGEKWGEYGESTMGHGGLKNLRRKHGEVPYGERRGGGGIGGSGGYFQEDMSVVPELGMLTDLVTEADTFAQQLGSDLTSNDWWGVTDSEGAV